MSANFHRQICGSAAVFGRVTPALGLQVPALPHRPHRGSQGATGRSGPARTRRGEHDSGRSTRPQRAPPGPSPPRGARFGPVYTAAARYPARPRRGEHDSGRPTRPQRATGPAPAAGSTIRAGLRRRSVRTRRGRIIRAGLDRRGAPGGPCRPRTTGPVPTAGASAARLATGWGGVLAPRAPPTPPAPRWVDECDVGTAKASLSSPAAVPSSHRSRPEARSAGCGRPGPR
jgi:hypothetical protein